MASFPGLPRFCSSVCVQCIVLNASPENKEIRRPGNEASDACTCVSNCIPGPVNRIPESVSVKASHSGYS